MPIRMLRDWTRSKKVNKLSSQAECFFARLIMKADDFGRFYADPGLLRTDLYPRRLNETTEEQIESWLHECVDARLITVYEVKDESFLEIHNFDQRLRAKKSQFPASSDGHMTDTRQTHDGHMPDTCRPEEKRREEKGREIEKEIEEKRSERAHAKELNGSEVVYSIEHCVTVALNDKRWTKANSTSERELLEFNAHLEKRGIYEKNPLDYKRHFANWKKIGKHDGDHPGAIPDDYEDPRERRGKEILKALK